MTVATGSQRQTLMMTGLSRSTWHYRHHPRARVPDPVPQRDRAYPARIDDADRAVISERITAGWQAGHSVDHAFAQAWDDGVMLGSRRSWWRIAAAIEDQSARPVAPTRRTAKTPREAPVLEATGPGQVWSWDITDLRTPWRGVAFKAYSIIDIYSRKLMGWRVEDREADELAVEMFRHSIAAHGAPNVVHADSGPAMRSDALKTFLGPLGITQTHNRPRVSNDNPFSESEFRTMKYRPNYPGTFTDIEHARAYMSWYVPWYNRNHKHSGIALFSPDEVHDGSWYSRWQHRERTQQAYYEKHPERFRNRPRTPAPANIVGINLPQPEARNQTERLHAA
ncbi:DDE-type integrase/transposase/recombinase [Agromyces bracchium]|uniref:DDE-type integrase/transposase/recombinase n=1 Tax=Agromyces bracchium TaxID=88376 RepID=A0A6I3M787_9MICO|nr:DDE-type integrase/transposase/recombinase [Agromyces bracchium]MTH67967.1 DDE-type integrase/transposase/recombinase [Agromyces bracchium]